jgi:hypothetical protein
VKLAKETEVLLQFLVNSENEIPEELLDMKKICRPMRSWTRKVETGVERKSNCDISKLPEGLYQAGYGIEKAYWEKRDNGKIAIRYFLTRGGNVNPREGDLLDALGDLVSSVWDAKIIPNTELTKIVLRNEQATKKGKLVSRLLVTTSISMQSAS